MTTVYYILQVEAIEIMSKVRVIFRYLKIKRKSKKTLSKIWFTKQCMYHNIIQKYAKIKINNNDDVVRKVKRLSERLWIKL